MTKFSDSTLTGGLPPGTAPLALMVQYVTSSFTHMLGNEGADHAARSREP